MLRFCSIATLELAFLFPIFCQAASCADHFRSALSEQKVAIALGIQELARLQDAMNNSSPIVSTSLEPRFRALFDEMSGVYDREKIKKLLRSARLDSQDSKSTLEEERRTEQIQVLKSMHPKMQFNRVEAGSFKMGRNMPWGDERVDVRLSHPFEMMSTHVTQELWTDIMAENPSNNSGKSSLEHPVERITWWSAIVYANRLSEAMGLEPAYDLSRLQFEGSADQGNLLALNPKDLKINAPNGDIYRTKGYRLPTEAEFEFVLSNRGRAQGRYFTGVTGQNLAEYAWFDQNSNGRTHKVAQLKPYVVDGQDFFDLNGNVAQWVHDWAAPLESGTDPQGPEFGTGKVTRGGDYTYPAGSLELNIKGGRDPYKNNERTGFRLVRTLK